MSVESNRENMIKVVTFIKDSKKNEYTDLNNLYEEIGYYALNKLLPLLQKLELLVEFRTGTPRPMLNLLYNAKIYKENDFEELIHDLESGVYDTYF